MPGKEDKDYVVLATEGTTYSRENKTEHFSYKRWVGEYVVTHLKEG